MSLDPEREALRLAELRSFDVLDTPPEEVFDRITRLASRLFATPIALVSLVDEDRQWFKSQVGIDATETPRDVAFCSHAIHEEHVFEVQDATQDPRFQDNPLVRNDPNIRFYAGAPLVTESGAVGTLCVIDREPRRLTSTERDVLMDLGKVVTEQLQLRRAAMQSRRRAALLELAERFAKVGHWRVVVGEEQLLWSPQVYSIYGVTPGAFVPTLESGVAAYHPEDRDRVQQLVEAALAEKEGFEFSLRILRPDGEIRHVHSVGRPEIDEAGDVRAIFGTFQDITELHEAAAEREQRAEELEQTANALTRANDDLKQFVSFASHDLQAPIRQVASFAAMLRRKHGGTLDDESQKWLDFLESGASHMRQLVSDLLDYSRAGRNDRPNREPVDLSAIAQDAMRTLSESCPRLTLAIDERLPTIGANRLELRQVLQNLFENASKYAQPDVAPRVRLWATEDDRGWVVHVSDNGIGVPASARTRIFEPFERGPGASQRKSTGIGLAICKRIVEKHGGTISVTANEAGVGSTFSFSIAKPEETHIALPVAS